MNKYDYAKIKAWRDARKDLPHWSGDTKGCPRCGTLIVRRVRHIPKLWNALKFCSRECGQRHPRVQLTQERFDSFVMPEPNSGCWLWTGSVAFDPDKRGAPRAKLWVDGKHMLAARVGWLLYRGAEPGDLEVCHKCDNPLCVNPGHLFLGTHQENMDDMVRKGRHPTPRGSASHRAKLTEQQVLKIKSDGRPARLVASDFGVSKSTVQMIRSGTNWGWLNASEAA